MPITAVYNEIIIKSEKGFQTLRSALRNVIGAFYFRGQSDIKWDLCTSLDRSINEEGSTSLDSQVLAQWYEVYCLKEIQQKIHNYQSDFYIPDKNESYSEWFPIIQHYGGP